MGRSISKKNLNIDDEIDQFCKGVETVLTSIHDRVDKTGAKGEKKNNKKSDDMMSSEELVPYSYEPEW